MPVDRVVARGVHRDEVGCVIGAALGPQPTVVHMHVVPEWPLAGSATTPLAVVDREPVKVRQPCHVA